MPQSLLAVKFPNCKLFENIYLIPNGTATIILQLAPIDSSYIKGGIDGMVSFRNILPLWGLDSRLVVVEELAEDPMMAGGAGLGWKCEEIQPN